MRTEIFISSPDKVSLQDGTRAGVHPCVHTFKHEYLRDQQADYNQILSEASLGWGKGYIRPDPTTDNRVSCPWASEKIPIDL